jgi:hypothetical protein
MEPIKIGDRIKWTSHGVAKRGTVVRVQRYPWAPGAGEIVALSDDDCLPTSFGIWMGYERIDGHETLKSCRGRYTAHLSQYAAWREHFANGISVGHDWGEFSGFGRVEVRS